ncbi:carboxylesterase family protein [Corynebacterium kutscheri]|uniref:Carboxylic ester hydrolase n=1 Tax=Corynebacterium kutscheri TaxID=35755 RepID=A0AB38VSG2_9CORY|nr:carboxylesterase family protein [Corynebacterium kutscheri]VEH06761.1 Carboxyl esterase type B [Corynebacterium kutscheri]
MSENWSQDYVFSATARFQGSVRDNVGHFSALPFATYHGLYPAELLSDPHSAISSSNTLCLDVTTPINTRPGTDLPVIAFIHGGAYIQGNRDEPWFDATALAQQGVIVVSLSYRLGMDGFARFPHETAHHYRGIDDCQLGLSWIQKHIEEFGGDPTNVTLAGQSAGAGIVLWLCRRDHYQGMFRRAWAMSPSFPRVPFEKRKYALRTIASTAITPKQLSRIDKKKRERINFRFWRLFFYDCPFGPAPFTAQELVDIPLIVSATSHEFYRHDHAVALDRNRLSKRFLPRLVITMAGIAKTYQPPEQHFFVSFLSDSLILRWVTETVEHGPENLWAILYQGDDEHPAVHCCDISWFFGNHDTLLTHPQRPSEVDISAPQAMRENVFTTVLDFTRGIQPWWPRYRENRSVLSISTLSGNRHIVTDPWRRIREAFL